MTIRDIINNDINDTRITDIVKDNIYYIHKEEEIEAPLYVEFMITNTSRTAYEDDSAMVQTTQVQIDIFATVDKLEEYYILDELIPKIMEEKDYIYVDEFEEYEEDTGLYRKGYRFNIDKFL